MIQIIALIYAGNRGVEGIKAFESLAIPILRQHQGVLVSASSGSQQNDGPDEIHIIQFPSTAAFESYKADVRHIELAEMRSECIAKIDLYITDIFHHY